MRHNSEHIEYESLIIRYLDGEADENERLLLLNWLKESAEHVREFNGIRDVHHLISVQEELFDAEKGFDRFVKQKQNSSPAADVYSLPKKTGSKRLMYSISAIAAVAIIAIALFFSVFKQPQVNTLAKAEKQAKQIKLQDGTIAFLSPNSEIVAENDFGSNHRRVSIKGEVFFKVKHDAKLPFQIAVNGVDIEDVGTAFKVKADSLTKNVSVRVQEGVVGFSFAGKSVTLTAGNYAYTDMKANKIVSGKIQLPKPASANTILEKIIFQDTPLAQVVERLNAKYHMNFVINDPELFNLKLNATIEAATSLDEVKNLLSLVLEVDIVNVDGKLIISKKDN